MVCNCVDALVANIRCERIAISKRNVAFSVPDEESKCNLITAIREDGVLNQTVEVFEPKPKCPTIKITNIDDSTAECDLITLLTQQNEFLKDDAKHLRLLFTIKKRSCYDAVLAISPHLHHRLTTAGLVYAGWTASKVEEIFLVNQCGKCFSFEHRARDCPHGHHKSCRNCGGSFSSRSTDGRTSEFAQHIRTCDTMSCVHCCKIPNKPSNHLPNNTSCPQYAAREAALARKTCTDPDYIIPLN